LASVGIAAGTALIRQFKDLGAAEPSNADVLPRHAAIIEVGSPLVARTCLVWVRSGSWWLALQCLLCARSGHRGGAEQSFNAVEP